MILGGLGEGPGFLDGIFWWGRTCLPRQDGRPAQFLPDFQAGLMKVFANPGCGQTGKLPCGSYAEPCQQCYPSGPKPPDVGCWNASQKGRNTRGGYAGKALRFAEIGCNFGEGLGCAESDGYGQVQLVRNGLLYRTGEGFVVAPEVSAHTGDVGKAFIDGVGFDLGGKPLHDLEHALGHDAVGFVIAGQDNEIGTHAACIPERDAAFDAAALGFVGGTGDDTAFLAGDNWTPTQGWVQGLLHGGKEGIAVDVQDGAWEGGGIGIRGWRFRQGAHDVYFRITALTMPPSWRECWGRMRW